MNVAGDTLANKHGRPLEGHFTAALWRFLVVEAMKCRAVMMGMG